MDRSRYGCFERELLEAFPVRMKCYSFALGPPMIEDSYLLFALLMSLVRPLSKVILWFSMSFSLSFSFFIISTF